MINPSPNSSDLENSTTAVTRSLDEAGIPYRFFRHPGPVNSLEQAADERGQKPEQIIRSILFRLEKEKYLMVLIAGPGQISWPRLRSYLGQSRLSMASEEEVLQVTGYRLGSVSPFGLSSPLRILLDESVLSEEEISIGSGEKFTTVILKKEELLKALGPVEIGSFRD